jgi:hypothetical protein
MTINISSIFTMNSSTDLTNSSTNSSLILVLMAPVAVPWQWLSSKYCGTVMVVVVALSGSSNGRSAVVGTFVLVTTSMATSVGVGRMRGAERTYP